MIKNFCLFFLCCAVCTLTAKTPCDSFYLRAEWNAVLSGAFTANNNQPDLQINDLGPSWLSYGGGAGYYLNDDFRMEVRVTHRNAMRYQYFSESVDTIDLTVGKLQNTTFTLGCYYQLFHLNRATTYIGAGVGYARNTLYDNVRLIDLDVGKAQPLGPLSSNSYCFFLSTGTWISLAPQWSIEVEGSYVNLGQSDAVLPNRAKLNNLAIFEFTLGLIYLLP